MNARLVWESEKAYVPPRTAIIRSAKRAKEAAGLCPILTDVELKILLPGPEDDEASDVTSSCHLNICREPCGSFPRGGHTERATAPEPPR